MHPWAYKSDISAFFDRIPRDELFDAVKRSVRTPSLNDLLRRAIDCEIDTRDPAIWRKVNAAGIVNGLGVRQGMPLSPLFANILLKEFDRVFLSRGHSLVRYAHDFIVFADN
jgi:retron-type reverse transcriptase